MIKDINDFEILIYLKTKEKVSCFDHNRNEIKSHKKTDYFYGLSYIYDDFYKIN